MVPRLYLLSCAILLLGLDTFCSCQKQQKERDDGHEFDNIFDNVERKSSLHFFLLKILPGVFINWHESVFVDLIAAEARNGERRSTKKKPRQDDDEYHQVYESKPQKYSRSYHHSDSYNDAPKTKKYGDGGRGYRSSEAGAGQTTYGSNHNNNKHAQRRNDRRGSYQDDDYDDYQDNPQEQSRPVKYTEDYDDDRDTSRSTGFAHKEDYDKEQRDDFSKSGKLNQDFDDFGREGQRADYYRNRGGRRNSRRKDTHSDSNDEISDSDYVDDGFNLGSNKNGRKGRDQEENPLDKYEALTRQALKTYGALDGSAFLSSSNR